jgi:predicted Rossmann fold nucleotide-binding protein DprA/Smf involved in DNA uptake
MIYGIVGSRKRKDKQEVIDFVKSLPTDSVIVSGGCDGVDS